MSDHAAKGPLSGHGFVAIWNDVVAGSESDFTAWHDNEHMIERLGLPGFLKAERWTTATRPRFFTLYTLAAPHYAASPAYRARLDAPTSWTQRVMARFRDTRRCVGAYGFSAGPVPGRVAVVAALETAPTREQCAAYAQRIMQLPGVAGCHIGVSDAAASALPSAERHIRAADEPAGLVFVALLASHAPDTVCETILGAFPDGSLAGATTMMCATMLPPDLGV